MTALHLSREEALIILGRAESGNWYLYPSDQPRLCHDALAAHDLADRIAVLEMHRKEAGEALMSLTPGGSEYFLPDADGFRVDVKACMAFIIRARDDGREARKQVVLGQRRIAVLEAKSAANDARYQELESNYRTAQANWELTLKRVEVAETARDEAVRAERERCARLIEGFSPTILHFYDRPGGPPGNRLRPTTFADLAVAIRALPVLPASESSPDLQDGGGT